MGVRPEVGGMSLAALPLRIIPAQVLYARRPHRLLERHFIINQSGGWMIVVSGFFEPLFYLLSIRVGFGSLVGDVTVGGRVISYAEFVAPALMASSAMNGAIFESTMNIYFQLKYDKVYDAALATPLTSGDVALGEILYATFRGSLYSAAFLVTLVGLGMAQSPWVVLALPVCVVIAIAFSAVGMAMTTYMRSHADFEYVPSLTLPLFLFSATFYPLSSYGDWGWLVQFSPLYHGVALVRGASFGEWSWAYIPHLGVLVAMGLVGLSVTARRIEKLLLQ
jgi:lipooligosaccharide transport system permease protein